MCQVCLCTLLVVLTYLLLICHPLHITSENVLDSTCFFVAEECATFKRCFLLSTANQFSCSSKVLHSCRICYIICTEWLNRSATLHGCLNSGAHSGRRFIGILVQLEQHNLGRGDKLWIAIKICCQNL